MNAAETIAAAIEKLETIQRDAVWTYSPENMDIIANATTVAMGVMPPDGDRIVMLHRTIDPQLDSLRYARAMAGAQIKGGNAKIVVEFGEQLATAILGETP